MAARRLAAAVFRNLDAGSHFARPRAKTFSAWLAKYLHSIEPNVLLGRARRLCFPSEQVEALEKSYFIEGLLRPTSGVFPNSSHRRAGGRGRTSGRSRREAPAECRKSPEVGRVARRARPILACRINT